ncbi:MAG: hypothetical protein IJ092_12005 [Atopobiaceae bacterium]|nr:hypothetical protein [Atopobiaceae bacterium]MBR1829014.1 hypothetical protein [Atopobiaceae bacterium]
MDLKQTADEFLAKGTSILDANGDGDVDAGEVLDAIKGRVKETAEAVAEAAGEVKKGFDADGDGAVSGEEVKVVADALKEKATQAVDGIVDKFKKE